MHCGASHTVCLCVPDKAQLPAQRLLGEPDDEEWPKFLRHAARLRVLGHLNTEFRPPLILAHTLAFTYLEIRRPVEWLFPNLRCVEWQFDPDFDASSILALCMMLSPRVEDVMVMRTTSLPRWAAADLLDELRKFALSHTNLQHLQVHCTKLTHPTPLVSDVIKGNRGIRTLEVWHHLTEPLSRETWLEIARLPRLEKTIVLADDFLGSEEEQQQLLKLSEPLFPSLRHVTVQARDVATFCRYLDCIHSSFMEGIALIITEAPTNEEVKTLFTKLTKHRSHASLRYLSFNSAFACPRDDDSYIITADTLRLLLSFRDLKSCHVAFHCSARPDDAFLSDAATAWGKTLALFDIGTGWRRRSTQPPAVTLMGLIAFASRCSRLAQLGVEFNPNVADFQEAYDAGERPCLHTFSHISRFCTGTSLLGGLEEPQIITLAGILSDLFPMLDDLVSLWDREEDMLIDEDSDDEDEREDWRKVKSLTKRMATIRMQERMWASLRGEQDIIMAGEELLT